VTDPRPFEVRLESALLRYTSHDGLVDAEGLARTIASGAAAGRPRPLSVRLGGLGRGPRLALVLAAALVVALVGGALLVGGRPVQVTAPGVGPAPTTPSSAAPTSAPSAAATSRAAVGMEGVIATCRGFPGVEVQLPIDRPGGSAPSDPASSGRSFAMRSDDGSTLTFWTGWPQETRVFVAGPDGSDPHEFPELGGDYGGQERMLSPDGKWFAWFDRRRVGPEGSVRTGSILGSEHPPLWITPTGGGPSRRLTIGSEIAEPYLTALTWSPDARSIAFAGLSELGDGAYRSSIYVIDVAGGAVRLLTDRPGTDGVAIAWSPDSRRIAYTALPDGVTQPTPGTADVGNQDIFVIGADGTRDHDVSDRPGEETGPIWSPDGRRLAYLVWEGSAERAATVEVDERTTGAKPRIGPAADVLTWSPDGSSILYRNGNTTSVIDAAFAHEPSPADGAEMACAPWPAPPS